jgi:hypothetical protein
MKFTSAWAKVASENANLKVVIICLSLVCVFFGVSTLKLATKEPIVVERGCFSKMLQPVSSKRTSAEIETFLKIALSQRFDSNLEPADEYISNDERAIRAQEQKELSNRHLSQKVILNSVAINGSFLSINADRLISVGNIRSALILTLTAMIESVPRSEGNPYGLILSDIKATAKEAK